MHQINLCAIITIGNNYIYSSEPLCAILNAQEDWYKVCNQRGTGRHTLRARCCGLLCSPVCKSTTTTSYLAPTSSRHASRRATLPFMGSAYTYIGAISFIYYQLWSPRQRERRSLEMIDLWGTYWTQWWICGVPIGHKGLMLGQLIAVWTIWVWDNLATKYCTTPVTFHAYMEIKHS